MTDRQESLTDEEFDAELERVKEDEREAMLEMLDNIKGMVSRGDVETVAVAALTPDGMPMTMFMRHPDQLYRTLIALSRITHRIQKELDDYEQVTPLFRSEPNDA